MDKINEIKKENIKLCQNILDKNDKQTESDLYEVEKIISKDNTEPIFINTYLKLLLKFKKNIFLETIKKYEYYLSKDLMNKEFSLFYQKKFSSAQLYYNLIEKIILYLELEDVIDKKSFYQDIILSLPKYDDKDIKGFTDYYANKELSIYILVQHIKNSIIKHLNDVKNYKADKNDPAIKFQLSMLKEAKIMKKVEDFDNQKNSTEPTPEEREIYLKRRKYIKKPLDDIIKDINDEINLRSKIASKEFSNYFFNLAKFLSEVKDNFNKRFKNIENLDDNNFNLFRYFCLFIEYYDFKDIKFYVNKWNDTFSQTIKDIENIIAYNNVHNLREYILNNNNLILKIYDKKIKRIMNIEIKNINKYSINSIMYYLHNKFISSYVADYSEILDLNNFKIKNILIKDYEIENCLKFDCIEDIYINKNWNLIEKHMIKIFTSPVIKSAFNELKKVIGVHNGYDFLNEHDLKKLLKRSKIFQFYAKLYGITLPSFFIEYIYYRGNIDSYDEVYSKLLNLCLYQVTDEHEMLGHLNVRLQKYLTEKEIYSPISSYLDENGKTINEQESGTYIELILYGRRIHKLNLNEILFLLDEENYSVGLTEFKNNFKNCKNVPYKISKSLEDFLNSLNIILPDEATENGEEFILNKDLAKKGSSNDIIFNLCNSSHADIFHPSKKLNDSIPEDVTKTYKWLYDIVKSNIE